ncbi:MAG: hypothetical protein J0H35_06980, partial [Rhodospirillales bacterium]|nr:hypothetical protein [Rhodospirillales bacterium]
GFAALVTAVHNHVLRRLLRGEDVHPDVLRSALLVNARISAVGRLPATEAAAMGEGRAPADPKGTRRVHLGSWAEVPVFDFAALGEDQAVTGPAIVESDTTTVLLRSGDRARYDVRGWLDVAVGGG